MNRVKKTLQFSMVLMILFFVSTMFDIDSYRSVVYNLGIFQCIIPSMFFLMILDEEDFQDKKITLKERFKEKFSLNGFFIILTVNIGFALFFEFIYSILGG
ncbi:MAG: hypothetical protein LBR15_09020 [Methanobrevibacter sp.]|jgi:hypothetical protein|nr:hypothetical protein [Candidatus Methanovirga australis]